MPERVNVPLLQTVSVTVVNVEFFSVILYALKMAPPLTVAVFPVKVQPEMVMTSQPLLSFQIAPPLTVAVFPAKVQPLMVTAGPDQLLE